MLEHRQLTRSSVSFLKWVCCWFQFLFDLFGCDFHGTFGFALVEAELRRNATKIPIHDYDKYYLFDARCVRKYNPLFNQSYYRLIWCLLLGCNDYSNLLVWLSCYDFHANVQSVFSLLSLREVPRHLEEANFKRGPPYLIKYQ